MKLGREEREGPLQTEHIVEIAVTYGLAVLAAIVWFVRLEGRVNLIERVVTDFINDRRTALDRVVQHMERIEEKVDQIRVRCAAYAHSVHYQYRDGDLPPDDSAPTS